MIPRYRNPHFLLQQFEPATRAELYADGASEQFQDDEAALERLQHLVRGTIQQDFVELSPSRRQVAVEESNADPVPFRLVSSTLPPYLISLEPPPPPPPKTREPEIEDNDEQALVRRQRAEAASINAEDILLAALVSESNARTKKSPLKMNASFEIPAPPIMILRSEHELRKTRPPVSPEKLARFPYVRDKPSALSNATAQKHAYIPVIDAEVGDANGPKKRRRQRKTDSKKVRPPPQFWRPDPSWTGPCMGYAYGYPSSFSVMSGYKREDRWQYKRDNSMTGRPL